MPTNTAKFNKMLAQNAPADAMNPARLRLSGSNPSGKKNAASTIKTATTIVEAS